MSDKPRWPLKEALIIAETLREVLALRCERIIIAGSIRRQKDDVGDIELLYIPRFEPRKIDLLNEAKVNVICHSLLSNGIQGFGDGEVGSFGCHLAHSMRASTHFFNIFRNLRLTVCV